MISKSYKTIIKGNLKQLSAFNTGGNLPHTLVDNPLCLDGLGRPTIRGTGLAGALIAHARTLYKDLPTQISAGSPSHQQEQDNNQKLRLRESVWRFHHSHPKTKEQAEAREYRSGVAISGKTGAAIEGAKFNLETLPVGTSWEFILEIDEYLDNSGKALPIALNTLAEWVDGYCWLGRDVARGLGWMKLEEMNVYRLSSSDSRYWPNSQKIPSEILNDNLNEKMLDNAAIDAIKACCEPSKPLRYLGKATISINNHQEDEAPWGIEMLSVGGEDAAWTVQDLNKDNLNLPVDQDAEKAINSLTPDKQLSWSDISCTENDSQIIGPQPIIPGSSIRGAMRHILEWSCEHLDAEDKEKELNNLTQLFGSLDNSAELLISDARICDKNYQLALIEMHAEDEFTGSTFASSKFNRMALLKGQFEFQFMFQCNNEDDYISRQNIFKRLNKLGYKNHIPIGSGQWRGMGWVNWHFELGEDVK